MPIPIPILLIAIHPSFATLPFSIYC